MDKPKIIHIILDQPNYSLYKNKTVRESKWQYDDGLWHDIFICEFLKISNEFNIEIWQPDVKTKEVYSYAFSNGFVHKLFPAVQKKLFFGFKQRNEIDSPAMLNSLKKEVNNNKTIIHLHGSIKNLNLKIIENKSLSNIIHTYHGDINLPINELKKVRKNWPSILNIIIEHSKVRKSINNINFLTYMNDKNLTALNSIYKGIKKKIPMGCNFNFWKKLDSIQCRKDLSIPLDKIVILYSSRLTSGKQVDKIILILKKLKDIKNYYFVITGRGSESFEKYLNDISKELLDEDLLKFTGFIPDTSTLLKYYSASDLFVIPSVTEGAPVAVMKALACEIPVLSSDVGHVAELLAKYDAGKVIAAKDYTKWHIEIKKILNGERVSVLDRKIAQKYYDWENVTREFLDIYKFVLNKKNK